MNIGHVVSSEICSRAGRQTDRQTHPQTGISQYSALLYRDGLIMYMHHAVFCKAPPKLPLLSGSQAPQQIRSINLFIDQMTRSNSRGSLQWCGVREKIQNSALLSTFAFITTVTVMYRLYGTGCAPLLQCLARLSLAPPVGHKLSRHYRSFVLRNNDRRRHWIWMLAA